MFVTVNATTGGRRKAADVERVRAMFADLDGAPLDPVLACDLEPHVVVESRPGRFHAYWIVEGLPLDQFTPVQKAIARRFGGDPKVCDLPRVMRMPGFWHQKADAVPLAHHPGQRAPAVPGRGDPGRVPADAATAGTANGPQRRDGEAQTMADLVRDVLTAENYHDALRNLAWRHLAGGMDREGRRAHAQGLMDASDAPRDDRLARPATTTSRARSRPPSTSTAPPASAT